MIGIAAGLALSGKQVYCYSIVPFLIMRAFEQIRIDVAYHNVNVKLIGVGGGISYGMEGYTHFGIEDFVLMRSLPNMTVVAPADPMEAKQIAKISCEYKGPMYIRLGKNGEKPIYKSIPNVQLGKAITIHDGKDIAIFAIGHMVHVGMFVVDLLNKRGIHPTLVNMHTLKPLDVEAVLKIAGTHSTIFSLEEHIINGGLGSAVAEVLSESAYSGFFKRVAIPEIVKGAIGHADYLRDIYGLSTDKVYDRIVKELSL
jgi:transketolase